MSLSTIEEAGRHHRILKELIRRERDYTRGFVNLDRLYDIGVLEKGLVGDPQQIAAETLDSLNRGVDSLCFLHIVACFEGVAIEKIRDQIAAAVGNLRNNAADKKIAQAAPNLLRGLDEFENSLKKILDLVAPGAIS